MLGLGVVEAVEIGGDGGRKTEQREIAEKHSMSGSVR
jgi:hypothetical protein